MSQCYVASYPGQPGAYAACSGDLDFIKEAAKFVTKERKRGATVAIVPTEKARAMLSEWLTWDQEFGKRAKKKKADQPALFADTPSEGNGT